MQARIQLYRRLISMVLVLGALEVAAAVAAVAVSRADYQALAMQAPSMSPAINPGDLILLQPVSPEIIHPGDVITFPAPSVDSGYVVHRVVRVVATPAGPLFTTRGDRSAVADPWSIEFNPGPGLRVAYVIPGLGRAFTFARSEGSALPIGVLVLAALLGLAWGVGVGGGMLARWTGSSPVPQPPAPDPQHPPG